MDSRISLNLFIAEVRCFTGKTKVSGEVLAYDTGYYLAESHLFGVCSFGVGSYGGSFVVAFKGQYLGIKRQFPVHLSPGVIQ